jgi:hypothetical protein
MRLFFANMKIDTMQLLDNFKLSVQDKTFVTSFPKCSKFLWSKALTLY